MRKILLGMAVTAAIVATGPTSPAIAQEGSIAASADAKPACSSGPYIVFFDWDKADITPEAATILDSAIAAYGNCDHAPIRLAGHTDRSGSGSHNMILAARRNDSVRAYLTGHGVPADVIAEQALGETMPRVPTGNGAREAQNRRVEITYQTD